MNMMPCQLVDNTQKLKPKQPVRTVIRLGPTPLKMDRVEKNILRVHEKIVVANHIHTHLSTSAHPVAQRMAAVHTRP